MVAKNHGVMRAQVFDKTLALGEIDRGAIKVVITNMVVKAA